MNFENFILGLLESSANFNFNAAIRGFLLSLAIIWLFVVVWVWMDSGERSRNMLFRILSVVLVFVLNILGLIIYLLMRPKDTIENLYWSDLERRFLLYETSELGDCENCGLQLRPGFNVCPSCSYPVNIECDTCKQMIAKHWYFCPYCATKQEHQFVGVYPESSHGVSTDAFLAAGMVNQNVSKAIEQNQTELSEPNPTVSNPEKSDEVAEEVVEDIKEEVVDEYEEEVVDEPDLIEEEIKVEDEIVEDIPTKEEMAESVKVRKEKINQDLDKKGMKYEKSPGVAVRLGNYVMRAIYNFGQKINDTALKVSGRIETPSSVQEKEEKQDEKKDRKKEKEKVEKSKGSKQDNEKKDKRSKNESSSKKEKK